MQYSEISATYTCGTSRRYWYQRQSSYINILSNVPGFWAPEETLLIKVNLAVGWVLTDKPPAARTCIGLPLSTNLPCFEIQIRIQIHSLWLGTRCHCPEKPPKGKSLVSPPREIVVQSVHGTNRTMKDDQPNKESSPLPLLWEL